MEIPHVGNPCASEEWIFIPISLLPELALEIPPIPISHLPTHSHLAALTLT